MTAQRPDQPPVEKLIALDLCVDGDSRVGELLGALKAKAYVASTHPFQEFEWLRDFPWADACGMVRTVVQLEVARLTKSGGSSSAMNRAYRTMEDSDRIAAMELAAWIVDHSNNNYISFPMHKIRHPFEGIKRTADSWTGCREALDRWCADELGRQRGLADEMPNQTPECQHRCQIHSAVAARLSAEQGVIQHARASALEKLLADLPSLPVRVRLEHIPRDNIRSLSCIAEDVKQLNPVTRDRSVTKLRECNRGL